MKCHKKTGVEARGCNNQEMSGETSVVNKTIVILKVIVAPMLRWTIRSHKETQETRKQPGKPKSPYCVRLLHITNHSNTGLHMYLCSSCGLDSESFTKSRVTAVRLFCMCCVCYCCIKSSFLCFVPLWMFGVVDKILETLCCDHIFTGVSIKAEKNSINILLKTRGCLPHCVLLGETWCWAVFLCSF